MAFVTTPPTRLLKVALLLAHAMGTYIGFTHSSVPPLAQERQDSATDIMSLKPHLQKAMVAVNKMVLCGFAVAEAVILLAQWCAPTTLLHRVIDALLSTATGPLDSLSLRLTSTSVIAYLLAAGGGLVRWRCYRTLGRFFTWEMRIQDDHELIPSGPYRIVRHPGYTGALLNIVGNFMLLWSGGSFFTESGLQSTRVGKAVVTVVVAYMSSLVAWAFYRTRTEDEMLRREFGKSWDEWSRRTPYRIIPSLY